MLTRPEVAALLPRAHPRDRAGHRDRCCMPLMLHAGLRAAEVLALASQNRSAGNYGNGKDSAALDSLKDSGDLEYTADVVVFLTEAQERLATPPARAVELTVAKHRHGDPGKVGLIFRPDRGTMREEHTAGPPR